jgi:sulfonate transport system permease protein
MSRHLSPAARIGATRWLSPLAFPILGGCLAHRHHPGAHAGRAVCRGPSAGHDPVGELADNLLVSFWRVALGLAIGVTIGVVLALVAGLSRRGEYAIDPIIQIKRTIPALALTPLFIVWFGIGETPKVALIAFASIFPVYLNLYGGIRGVDVRLVEGARSFGLSRAEQIWHVILPGALPSLLVGLRYSLSIAILCWSWPSR